MPRNKIDFDGNSIEFFKKDDKWKVRHNGVEKETKLVTVNLSITMENGAKVTPKTEGLFLVYTYNPTCVSYWNGASWVQFCW